MKRGDTMRELRAERDQLRTRVYQLEHALGETLWMARRYAHGRRSYAVDMFNRTQRHVIQLGLQVKADQVTGSVWAWDADLGWPDWASEAGELHRPTQLGVNWRIV